MFGFILTFLGDICVLSQNCQDFFSFSVISNSLMLFIRIWRRKMNVLLSTPRLPCHTHTPHLWELHLQNMFSFSFIIGAEMKKLCALGNGQNTQQEKMIF